MDDSNALAETVAATPTPGGLSAPSSDDAEGMSGATLDHFSIGERLGKGGMGEVYAATDTSLDRPVAIKVLRPELTAHAAMSERFLREARAQACFNHPNIVHIYYIGRRPTPSGEASLFFAMERVAGGDLDDLLTRGEVMPPEEARLAMLQVARGLRAAHRAGVIHRDIKPSNLMVSEEGLIKIADFGLAKPMDGDNQITQEGSLVGSPYYMSPEQAVGDAIDHRADMYSLGASFYHLLSGRPPFDGPRPMAVVAKHLSEDLTPLREVAPHVSPRLAKIVERLLAKKPDDRFEDYDALIAALEAAAPRPRAHAPFMTRAAAALVDFFLAGALIGALRWVGLLVYLVVVTVGYAWRGQSPAKFLLGIEVIRDDGGRLGWLRAAARTVSQLWMPILAGGLIALTSGVPELLNTIETLHTESIDELRSVLVALGISHGAMSILYFVGLGLALFHPEDKTVHDLLCRTQVVYRLKARAASAASGSSAGSQPDLESLGKKLSTRPPPADGDDDQVR